MNSRYREIHRAEIKRRMYRIVDRRWDALYGAFSASVVLAGFGISFCLIPRSGSCVIGSIFFVLAALFFIMYRWLLRILRNQGNSREWLKPLDHLVIAVIIGLAIALSRLDSGVWLAVFLMAGVFGTWRLRKYSKPHWRTYYFRAGREYFREIKSYRSNNTVKRDVPNAARALP